MAAQRGPTRGGKGQRTMLDQWQPAGGQGAETERRRGPRQRGTPGRAPSVIAVGHIGVTLRGADTRGRIRLQGDGSGSVTGRCRSHCAESLVCQGRLKRCCGLQQWRARGDKRRRRAWWGTQTAVNGVGGKGPAACTTGVQAFFWRASRCDATTAIALQCASDRIE